MVGVSGFEPEASWSRTKRDTKLRHTPIFGFVFAQRTSTSILENVKKSKSFFEKVQKFFWVVLHETRLDIMRRFQYNMYIYRDERNVKKKNGHSKETHA